VKRLHVTNGDQAAKAIVFAGLADDVLPWRDVLHDGPVPNMLKLNDLSRIRAEFIAQMHWGANEELGNAFASRDAAFGLAAEHGRITLWFESDLYDQLQLAQILAEMFVAHTPLGEAELIQVDDYLGPMDVEGLRKAYDAREIVSAEHLEIANRIWQAYRFHTPYHVVQMVQTDYPPLPHLSAAIRRLLQEYPWTTDGLSRTERATLEAISGGVNTPAAIFTHVTQQEDRIYLGDSSFAGILHGLSAVGHPLVEWSDGEIVAAPSGTSGRESFWHRPVRLTATGRRVLERKDDHVRLNGIDKWIGGVHISEPYIWRYNPETRELQRL
jgi:hypothetical protein